MASSVAPGHLRNCDLHAYETRQFWYLNDLTKAPIMVDTLHGGDYQGEEPSCSNGPRARSSSHCLWQ